MSLRRWLTTKSLPSLVNWTDLGVEAVAILFMHSYRRPDHEVRAKRLIEDAYPDMFVTASHELAREYREFERTSTVATNAYVGPMVRDYIGGIDGFLSDADFDGTFLVVQSTGGLFEPERAKRECVRNARIRSGYRG